MSYDYIICKKCGNNEVDPFHHDRCLKCNALISDQFEDIFKSKKPKSIVDVLLEKRANK